MNINLIDKKLLQEGKPLLILLTDDIVIVGLFKEVTPNNYIVIREAVQLEIDQDSLKDPPSLITEFHNPYITCPIMEELDASDIYINLNDINIIKSCPPLLQIH